MNPDRPGCERLLGALAGLLAAGVGLAAAEVVAAFAGPSSSPVVAVGEAAIALTPESVKSFAIRTFGERDKLALVAGTLVVLAFYALVVGLVSLRSRRLGAAGIALFGLLGTVAAVTRPAGRTVDGLPSFVGAAVGIVALLVLVAPLTAARVDAGADVSGNPTTVGLDRRRFFVAAGMTLGAAVIAGGSGRLLQRRFEVADERSRLTLPTPASPAAALPAGADLGTAVPGLTPLFTGNRDFYRVDTAISAPQIRPADYRLTLTGMFDSPREYSLPDLYRRKDLIERDITLTCVSNEVGGTLAGSARWLGVPLGTFLRENGVRAESSQLVCRSVDGMTIGAPTRSALDVEDAMLAFGMNGEPLPIDHGFPVRMVIPGLYGYVSACKWLTAIEATTFEAFDAYWVQRLWARQGPIKVESRIDTPAPSSTFAAGRRAIAGVAWAQTRGISRVEVRVDQGSWAEARLSPEVGADLWRQWVVPHDFGPGPHQISVRATSGDGELQTEARADPFPAGASGWHTIQVAVR
ncbi:MAG: oxidoreductase molybdopterin binding protein [Blastococcus sp.]|nr:oxidoreductase molybdopterin binding protein [Blastococcus sp.]